MELGNPLVHFPGGRDPEGPGIFKVFIEFITILFLFFFLMFWFFGIEACGILAPQPEIEPAPSALESEVSTNV